MFGNGARTAPRRKGRAVGAAERSNGPPCRSGRRCSWRLRTEPTALPLCPPWGRHHFLLRQARDASASGGGQPPVGGGNTGVAPPPPPPPITPWDFPSRGLSQAAPGWGQGRTPPGAVPPPHPSPFLN